MPDESPQTIEIARRSLLMAPLLAVLPALLASDVCALASEVPFFRA